MRYIRAILNYPATVRAIGLVTEPELHLSNIRNRTALKGGVEDNAQHIKLFVRKATYYDLPGLFDFVVEEVLLPDKVIDIVFKNFRP